MSAPRGRGQKGKVCRVVSRRYSTLSFHSPLDALAQGN
jgi:hypothetical protein